MPRESTIQIYRSTTAANTPSLTAGEMAVNIPDRKLFVGGTAGNIVFLDQSSVVTSVNSLTGAVTNVAVTNAAQSFSGVQNFTTGVSAAGGTFASLAVNGGNFLATTVGGDEGGEIHLGLAATNTTLTGSYVVVDIYQNRLRFFEAGGNNRGYYMDISAASNGAGSQLSTSTPYSPPLASASVTGVASFGNEFVVSAAGAVSLTANYVKSVNGSTGAITNVATTNTANTFTQTQSFAGGFTSAGITAFGGIDAASSFRFIRTNIDPLDQVYTIQPSFQSVPDAVTLTLPNKTGTVALTSEVVTSVNSLTGAITNVARTNAAQSFTGVQTFSNGISVAFGATFNSVATNGIATFTGLVTANRGVTSDNLYVSQGATFASRIQGVGATFTGTVEVDTGLILPNSQNITSAVTTFNGASGAVTFAVPLASATVTGAASFGNQFVVSAAGAVSLTSNYVISVNGSTGAVVSIATTGANTFTGLQTMNAGATANNLYVTNGATFAGTSSYSRLATFSGGLSAGAGVTFGSTIYAPHILGSWNVITADQTAAINTGYLTNKATLLTLTLPTTAAVGSRISVSGMNAGGWKIAQNASQIIHFGKTDTTTGTGGYLQNTLTRDSVELVCCVANNEWNVISSIGNITIV